MLSGRSSAVWLILVAVLCFGAVGAALVSQYYFDMLPCPWCTFQRLIFIVTGLLALVGALMPALLQRLLALLATVMAACGIASALWQHFVAAASDSCALTLADRVMQSLGLFRIAPSIFSPQASCADAAVNLLGLPYEFWSLGLFALAGLACARVAFSRR
jgi:disulfide bond formation protein DsbB